MIYSNERPLSVAARTLAIHIRAPVQSSGDA